MAVTTKILFPATSNSSTTNFSLSGLQLNNQDDLDVYVTKTTAGIAANNNKRILHNRQSTSSNVDANHKQVNNTDGLYFPAITHTGGTETLENYEIINNNGTVRFNSPLPQGAIVFVERRTRDDDGTYTSFASGSTIRATDLNNSSTESNFTAQEARNKALTIEGVLFDGDQPNTNFVTTDHIVNGTIVEADLANSAVTQNKLANNSVGTTELINGSVTTDKLANDNVTLAKLGGGALPTDITVASANIVDGTITTADIGADQITSALIADDQIGSEHYIDGSIGAAAIADDAVGSAELADNAVANSRIQDNAVNTPKIANDAVTIDKIADSVIVTNSEQASSTPNDTSFFTTAAAEARYFNVSTGETIKDGDTFPDNDTTIATTAAINDRIIDLIDDVGGFDIIQSEQHFPNTNPQGTTGQAAVLSIKAASTNLVPSGTTVTISNGNLANNANIIITGVTSTIPTGFGFLVESTSTTHTYAFHRLVPKATEVTTVAGNITNINAAANNTSNINAAVSNASNINAAVSNASNINAAVSNASNINAAVSNASNINSAVSNASNITTTASNIANVNNVGTNIAKVNSVAAVIGGTQTFTVTVSGGVFYIDGQSKPVLTLARGFTYTFNQADGSNSGHPLAFKDSSDNAYTTGVTVNGTAGNSGATVVFAVPSNAPSSLKYYCTVHGNGMGNTITVTDDNIGTVAGSIGNVNTTAGSITNVNNVGSSISNINTVASNLSSVNNFFNVYRIGQNNPTTSLDTGDLFFNTTSNSLKVYTGSAWVDGVTATGNFAVVTGNTFTGSNVHNDNVKSLYGTGSDLEIYHNGTRSEILNNTGDLIIQTSANNKLMLRAQTGESHFIGYHNGQVELYYDGSKKFETWSSGARLPADNTVLAIGAGDDLRFWHNATNSIIRNATGQLQIQSDDLRLGNYNFTETYLKALNNGAVELYHNNVKKLETTANGASITGRLDLSDNLDMPDTAKVILGDGDDLKIYHNGSNSYIDESGTGSLILRSNQFLVRNITNDENMIVATANGSVDLYYNNVRKLHTRSDAVNIIGDLDMTDADGYKINLGANSDLQIYHDGTNNNSYIQESGSGNLVIGGDMVNLTNAATTESYVRCTGNAQVELYYNNSKKLETTNLGTKIIGDLFLDNPDHAGSDLQFDSSAKKLKFDDNVSANFGSGDDCNIYHDGSDSYIDNNTGNLNIICDSNQAINLKHGSENMLRAITDGAVELYYDNGRKLETTTSGVTVTGDVNVSNDVLISSSGEFYGYDNAKLVLGHGRDLQIYHDGSDSRIKDSANLKITTNNLVALNYAETQYILRGLNGAQVELYHAGDKRLETTTNGATITGGITTTGYGNTAANNTFGSGMSHGARNVNIFASSTSANPYYSYVGTNLKLNGTNLVKNSDDSGNNWGNIAGIVFEGANQTSNSGKNPALRFVLDQPAGNGLNYSLGSHEGSGSQVSAITSRTAAYFDTNGHFYHPDNKKAVYGNGEDLEVYHDGSNSYVKSNTGDLIFQHGSENLMQLKDDGAVELYYDNSKKLETQSGGVKVTGNLDCDGIRMVDGDDIRLGNSDDLQLVHSSGVNQILTNGPNIKIGTTGETFALFNNNGGVNLYYDNDLKLHTRNNGIVISNVPDNEFCTVDQNGRQSAFNNYFSSGSTGSRIGVDVSTGATDGSKTRSVDFWPNGMSFNGDTAADNRIDDYEVGTFTPNIQDAASGGNSHGNSGVRQGKYVKIGSTVTIMINCRSLSNSGLTGVHQIYITNLPFRQSGVERAIAFSQVQYFNNVSNTQFGMHWQINNNETIMRFHKMADNSGANPEITFNHWMYSSGYYGFATTFTYITDQ